MAIPLLVFLSLFQFLEGYIAKGMVPPGPIVAYGLMPECFGSHFNIILLTTVQGNGHLFIRGFGITCKHNKARLPTVTAVKGCHKPLNALLRTTLCVEGLGVHQHEVAPLQLM